MARLTDTSKIEAIKVALTKTVVKDGIEHTSIAKIAEEAQVSVGYLYRHYKNKDHLIQAVYTENVLKLITILNEEFEKDNTFSNTITHIYIRIINWANKNENDFLFFQKVFSDLSNKVSPILINEINTIANNLLAKGKAHQAISNSITAELVFLQFLSGPFYFVILRKKGIFLNKTLTKQNAKHLAQLFLKSVA